MKKKCLLLGFSFFLFAAVLLGSNHNSALAASASSYLGLVMDQYHQTVDVYTDGDAAGNHFVYKGRMPGSATDAAIPPMKECYRVNPHTGINAIECVFNSTASTEGWGGWYFMNGLLEGDETKPKQNWGDKCGAGLDLRGATELSFYVQGATGNERVDFFCFGVGRAENKKCKESNNTVRTGYITLPKRPEWKNVKIKLQGTNLSSVLGGFGWVASKQENNNRNIKFYLDDIRYELNKAKKTSRQNEPRFLVSYRTESKPCPNTAIGDFDIVMRNAAFTYDSAVALLAFLATGTAADKARAKLLADALVYAYYNDRYYRNADVTKPDSRRLRNAYQGGDLILWPGWTPNGVAKTVRMPGFTYPGCYPNCTDKTGWREDEFQVSTHTGNIAWAMLALLGYYENTGQTGNQYLQVAKALGEWVEWHCRDSQGLYGGYTGGYEGWEKSPKFKKLTYKATEHNIDLYAAFQRLADLTTGPTEKAKWQDRANNARKFVEAMWFDNTGICAEKHFWTGTKPIEEGGGINPDVIPLDIQAWANMAFRGETKYRCALNFAEGKHRKCDAICSGSNNVGCGYDFDTGRDGIWYEGTAHMAVAYKVAGQSARWTSLLNCLHKSQYPDGGLPAANRDVVKTGFKLPDGKTDWLLFRRAHVGATAWLVLAEKGVNPFWFGHP